MTETADFYISCLRPLCFTFAASMFHACGLYVSCLRPLSTTHGYDKGRIAFWGARKRLGALAVLCGFERRACKQRGWEAGLKHRGWVRAFGLVLFGRAFRGSFFWSFFSWLVLLVRAFGRSFRGSCFWSFFSWFVLLVVLFVVRAFGFVLFVVRSSGSCFWGLVCVFLRCFKILRGVCGKVRGFLMQR